MKKSPWGRNGNRAPSQAEMLRNPDWYDPNVAANPELVKQDALETLKFSRERMNQDLQIGAQLQLLQRDLEIISKPGLSQSGARLTARTDLVNKVNTLAQLLGRTEN